MIDDKVLREALTLLGFKVGSEQESRPVAILRTLLKIQGNPPVPRGFADIYDSILNENPEGKLSKAWVHRVLKPLIEDKLVRVEGQSRQHKRYIADVNTIMTGLEQLKTNRLHEIDEAIGALQTNLDDIIKLDCGVLAQQLVKALSGREQTPTTRIVRGVEELDRVLKYNVTSVAKKGDIIRATVLWLTPLLKGGEDRMMKFIDAAKNGADIRYLVTIDILGEQELVDREMDSKKMKVLVQGILKMREAGLKFDVRLFPGIRTYSQVSLNNQSTALVITENPLTATWLTREFNPDLIDNAVVSFDKHWNSAKSIFELTSEDFAAFGAAGGTLAKMLLGE
ncbi:MAG: hypothetical protein ACXADC_04650 [Candidatus Thorarchaeota archaeon]|jgi:hypothetical protein